MFRKIFFSVFLVAMAGTAMAQTPTAPAAAAKDPFAVEALNGFPLAIRQATLEVALHANLLQEVLKLQKANVDQFKTWIQPLPENAQRQVYQVVRFPKLVNELVTLGAVDPKKVGPVLKDYPTEIHAAAKELAKTQMPLLQKTNDLNSASNEKFEKLIEDYPAETRKAYHTVLQHPVILEILSRHPDYSYLLGHVYGTQYPTGQKRVAEVDDEARKKDQATAAAHKQARASGPADQALDAAAQKFCQEANAPLDQVEDPSKAVQVTAKYDPYFFNYYGETPGFYNQPYWYGFPAWGYPIGWW